jgi:glycosyltransferase involved in cell wall biosynthesis
MNILLLAPHPFYKERGTPIAVNLLLKAFAERKYKVDVVTYHEGLDVEYDNMRLHRVQKIPGVHNISPGFSWKKLLYDFMMAFTIIRLVMHNKYDVIHAVEESVFFGLCVKTLLHIPYIYDMDSSLSQQIIDKKPFLKIFTHILQFCEHLAVKHAIAVVPVCDALYDMIQKYHPRRVVVLHDVSLLGSGEASTPENLRVQGRMPGLLVMYVGNLESYQGIDLLLESFALVLQKATHPDLVIIGGDRKDINMYERKAQDLAIGHKVHILGPKPLAQLSGYLSQADILVSGENTPMKLYSYLHSGTALLATKLPTHTQVLNSRVAMLADATPAAFSEAMLYLMRDEPLRIELGRAGKKLIEEHYSYASFRSKIFELFDVLETDLGLHQTDRTSVLHHS